MPWLFLIAQIPIDTVVTVRGVAHPGDQPPETAPLSGRPCVAWEVLLVRRDVRTLGGDGDDQEVVHRWASPGHFLIDDGTGTAAVFLGRADVRGIEEQALPCDARLDEFLAARGMRLPAAEPGRSITCYESIITPLATIEVTGLARWTTLGVSRCVTIGRAGANGRDPAPVRGAPAVVRAPAPPLPTVTSIGAAEDGMYAQISGVASKSGAPLVAPLSGRPCLLSGVSVIGYAVQALGGDGDDWSEVMQRIAGDSFLVTDTTGCAWVSVAGAGLRLGDRLSYPLTDVQPRNALTAMGVPVVDLEARGLILRAYETILPVNAKVTITGVTMWEADPDPTRAGYRDMPRRLAMRSTGSLAVTVTVD